MNNLSVTLLSQGQLKEAIDVLETALKTSPSSVVIAEPFLFNLCEFPGHALRRRLSLIFRISLSHIVRASVDDGVSTEAGFVGGDGEMEWRWVADDMSEVAYQLSVRVSVSLSIPLST